MCGYLNVQSSQARWVDGVAAAVGDPITFAEERVVTAR
jgi:hypothetical protein